MTHGDAAAKHRLGPLVAGLTSGELCATARQDLLGLRLLDAEDHAHDFFRSRSSAISSIASEFFYNYQGSSSLIFQKTRETPMLPDFVEYLFCWLADDRLCGAILSGVASDAGTHAQINAQESVFCEHAAEVDRALASRYSAITDPLVSFFNFETYQALPQITALPPEDFLSAFQRLVTTSVDGEPSTQLETHYCGPSFLLPSRKKSDSEIPTAATHSTQASSQAYANEETVVIHDFKVERYVRTIESIHVFENLVYLSRVLAETIGKRLNSERCGVERNQAQAEIDRWNESLRLAEEAKTTRIHALAEIL